MKFLKNGETNLVSLRKICGEIINIESGKTLYRNGELTSNDGKPLTYETSETKYKFYHTIGTIFIPSHWSHDEMIEFSKVLFELLEDEFPINHLRKKVATQTFSHTTAFVNMEPKRHYYLIDEMYDNKRAIVDNGFTWNVKPLNKIPINGTDVSNAINAFASIVYDKFDVFDVEDGQVIVNPGLHNLRVYPYIHSEKHERISYFKHSKENFPFLDKWIKTKDESLSNFSAGVKFEFKDYPTGSIKRNSHTQWVRGLPNCHNCGKLLYGLIYLKKAHSKYETYCITCPHMEKMIESNTTPTHISRAPTSIQQFMEYLDIPKYMYDVYISAERDIMKIKIDNQVHPGQKIYQIGDYIAIDDANFDKFIYSPRALTASKLGKIINAHIIVIE